MKLVENSQDSIVRKWGAAAHLLLLAAIFSSGFLDQKSSCVSALSTPTFLFAVCADSMTCDSFKESAALSIQRVVRIREEPSETNGTGSAAPPSNGRGVAPIPTIVIYVIPADPVSDETPPDVSSTSMYFGLLAGVEYALRITNTTVESTMMFVPTTLVTPAIFVSNHLNIAYVVRSYRPLPGVVTSSLDRLQVSTALEHKLCRGVIEYAVGGLSYVVGAVASELSTTGSIALVTGPAREPSVTMHAYVREGLRTHCPACVLSGLYLEPWLMTNASLLAKALVEANMNATGVDVALLDVDQDVLFAARALLDNTYGVKNITVLCVDCDDGVTVTTIQAVPLIAALQDAFSTSNAATATAPKTYPFSLESSVGISVTIVCPNCISARALRTYADTTAAITTLFDTYGATGVERLLTLPMTIGGVNGKVVDLAVDSDSLYDLQEFASSPWRPSLYKFSADPASVMFRRSVAAVATSCDLTEQLQQSGIGGLEQCAAVVVSRGVQLVSVLIGGVSEWVAPQRKVVLSPSVEQWLAQSSDHVLPDSAFSVDAVSEREFLILGGERETAQLPQARNDMFMLSFTGGSSPASFATVLLELILPAPASAIPSPRANHAHTVFVTNEKVRKLFVHGGRGTGGAILKDLWSFHILDKTWTQLTPSSTTRSLHKLLLSRRLGDDTILTAWAGESLVPLQTIEQYSMKRDAWFPVASLPVTSTACAAPIGPLHIAFLEANKLSPCLLDVLSLSYQCASRDVAALMDVVPSASSLMCVGVKTAVDPLAQVGLLVVATSASGSADTSLVVVPRSICPAPYNLQFALSNVSGSLSVAGEPLVAGGSALVATPSSVPMSPGDYQRRCAPSCPSQAFPFMGVCWPCSVVFDSNDAHVVSTSAIETIIVSPPVWLWTNLSLSLGSSDYIALVAAASTGSSCATSLSGESEGSSGRGLLVPLVSILLVFVASALFGSLAWFLMSQNDEDKESRCAPIAPPVTFVLVDVHGSNALWKTDPVFHALYLDVLSDVTRKAIKQCQVYRVRRVGDAGYLIACSNVPSAIRFVQVLRRLIRCRVLQEVKGAQESAARYVSGCLAGTTHSSFSSEDLTSFITDTTKFAVHSTSCLSIRRTRNSRVSRRGRIGAGRESIEYDGEDVFVTPSVATHSTKRGEISFTLDAISELVKFNKEAVADGAHLRKASRDTEYADISHAGILAMLGSAATIPSSGASAEQTKSGGDSSAGHVAAQRVCLNGTHIRVLRSHMLEPAVKRHHGERLPPPRPGHAPRDDNTTPTFLSQNDEHVSLGGGAMASVAVGEVTAGMAGDELLPTRLGQLRNDTVMQQLDALYDFLDMDTAHPAVLSRQEFAAMRHLIGFVLCSAIHSLEDPQAQEEIMQDLARAFALSDCVRRSAAADELLVNSPEGRKLVFFEHLAARVLQCLEPLRVKRYLAHCTAAGKAAAALGVGDFSSTAAAGTQ